MSGEGAAAALAAAVTDKLRQVAGLSGVFDGPPVQAGDAHAVLEMGPEADWGHKSGEGAELRFAVLIRCGGEAPQRVRALLEAARQAIGAAGGEMGDWRLVTLAPMRTRTVREPGPRWVGVTEYRARMLRV